MSVTGISAATSTAALTSAATKEMGKEDFLLLLITQLQNQDPLDPMDNSDFVAQLAQFSTLEQMENLNAKFEDQASLILSLNNTMAVSYVGKDVVLGSSALEVGDSGSARFGVHMVSRADDVTVQIVDAAGELVRSFSLGELAAGTHEVDWDGLDGEGHQVLAGTYGIKVVAADGEGNALNTALPVVIGTVESLSYQNGAAYFNVGGTRAPIAALIEVLNASANNDAALL